MRDALNDGLESVSFTASAGEASSPAPASVPDTTAGRELLGLARHADLFRRAPYSIRDAVYGSVPLSHAAYATLNTRIYQRLRHIKQVGPVYLVYPGANHTRFSHGIGVYYLTLQALQHLIAVADITPEAARACLAAALLHDLGHFPFSHLMDEISINGRRLSHADLSADLVLHDEELGAVLDNVWQVDRQMVADLITGTPNPRLPRFLNTLIDGPMDLDKLDYLNRDSYHAGVPYGRVEVQRLIDFLAVDPRTNDLAVTESGVGTVESVIFAKYLMFRYVYWHHTARIASTMLNRAILDVFLALDLTNLDIADPRFRSLCLATADQLVPALPAMLNEAGQAPPPSFELLGRVEARRLCKRAVALSCADEGGRDRAYSDALIRRAKEEDLNRALSERTGAPLRDFDVLLDVPRGGKFAADVRGVIVRESDGRTRVVKVTRV
ncbi:MAG: HD domain-containing protein [Chloroflexi bacterium]|nr:HD domain-containing protein [Chloroflexota bacterium]